MDQLVMTYRELDRDLAILYAQLNSLGQFERKLFLPTTEAKETFTATLQQLNDRIDALPAPDPVYALLKRHFADFSQLLVFSLAQFYERPFHPVQLLTRRYDHLVRTDSRSSLERADMLTELLNQSRALYHAITAWLPDVDASRLNEALNHSTSSVPLFRSGAEKIDAGFPGLPAKAYDALHDALLFGAAELEDFSVKLSAVLAEKGSVAQFDDSSIVALTEAEYRDALWSQHGVELDELLAWHQEEIEKTRAAVFEVASHLPLARKAPRTMREVNDVLLEFAGPCDTPEEMLARGRNYIQRTKAEAKKYVHFPEEECLVGPVFESLKDSYPWGGYGRGCPLRRPLRGEMFLNTYNYRAVTDGWIKMNTIHEAYPGHHVQFVRVTLDPIPETLKIGAKHTPLLEGPCHRSEKLIEHVFEEDPYFPLFVAYRRHHTAVRIKADLLIRYFGRPLGDAVQLYVDELDFDRGTSRGQVLAQVRMSGYFNSYYYGYKKLVTWEKEMGFDSREYTELLFSPGRMSMDNFHSYLLLSPEDRKRLEHDFASLLQFDENYKERV